MNKEKGKPEEKSSEEEFENKDRQYYGKLSIVNQPSLGEIRKQRIVERIRHNVLQPG